jgi:hypothetical protein
MAGHDMPSEHLTPPATFKANDVITMYRSPDRDGRGPINLGFCCRFSKARKCCMNGRDQRREFVSGDLISPNIGGDDVGRQVAVE